MWNKAWFRNLSVNTRILTASIEEKNQEIPLQVKRLQRDEEIEESRSCLEV